MEVLFRLHNRAIFRTAYGIVRNYDLAEDVTQQTFIELYKSIKRYDLRRPFPPWLHRIAVHRSLNELRRHERQNVPIETASDMRSASTSPEEAAEQSELRAGILNALGALDPTHRAAIVLRYYHGFNEAEMAVALRCRRGTVKSRLHYALRHLREIMAEQAPSLTDTELPHQALSGCGERDVRGRPGPNPDPSDRES